MLASQMSTRRDRPRARAASAAINSPVQTAFSLLMIARIPGDGRRSPRCRALSRCVARGVSALHRDQHEQDHQQIRSTRNPRDALGTRGMEGKHQGRSDAEYGNPGPARRDSHCQRDGQRVAEHVYQVKTPGLPPERHPVDQVADRDDWSVIAARIGCRARLVQVPQMGAKRADKNSHLCA